MLQIVIGLVIGTLLALFCPEQTSFIKGFGDLFVKALKSVAPLLVLVLVTSAIAAHQKEGSGHLWKLMIIYFVSTFLAAVTAVGASFLFPVSVTLTGTAGEGAAVAGSISAVLYNIVINAVDNPVNALINANYISILVWAAALGYMFRNAKESTKAVLEDLASVVTAIVRIDIRLVPLGVMGLVYLHCLSGRHRRAPGLCLAHLCASRRYGRFRPGDKPGHCLRHHPQKPLPAGFQMSCRERLLRLLHQKLRCQHPGKHGALRSHECSQKHEFHFHPSGRHR